MESSVLDQFLFVNKTPRSKSLSHSSRAERFSIHAHVHAKHHKQKRAARQSRLPYKDVSSQSSKEAKDQSEASNCRYRADGTNETYLRQIIVSQPGICATDPFQCGSIRLEEREHRLLQYPWLAFIRVSFTAEAMSMEPEKMTYQDFRHRRSITSRLQRCMVDELTLYSTLAFCANYLQWAVGENPIPDRPLEYYNLKAIEVLKSRIADVNPAPDSWLILAIYALSVSDMWVGNFPFSTKHMEIIRQFVIQLGGIKSLDHYLMDSLIMGDKYLAIGKWAPPVLPFDWDPGPYSEQMWARISMDVDFSALGPPCLASGFFELSRSVLEPDFLAVIIDIVECLRVAHCLSIHKRAADPVSERWLFLRHQGFVYRILHLPVIRGSMQDCCRTAIIIWLCKNTAYHGAGRKARELLCQLKAAMQSLNDEDLQTEPGLKLLFWMQCLGAMTAEYTFERNWFLEQVVESASVLNIEIMKSGFWSVLENYLMLKTEGGLLFARMVRAAREKQIGRLCDSPNQTL